MKQKQFILIIAIMLLSIGLFAANDMGKGGSYDGAAMLASDVISMGDIPLPVNLSSFTAIQTSANFVQINWTTQSETGLVGYNVYRNVSENINTGLMLNYLLIDPSNTSSESNYSFIDEEVEFEQTYYYWLESVEQDGSSEYYGPILIRIEEEEIPELPNQTVLQSAYPNPFNPTTTIAFDIKEGETGILTIFNVKGQKVISESFVAGSHEYKWQADKNTSGVYFYKLQTESYSKISKMLMLK